MSGSHLKAYEEWFERNGYDNPASIPMVFMEERDCVLELCRNNGLALQYAHPNFRNDKEIALAAIMNNPDALQYVSDALCADQEILRASVILSRVRCDMHSPSRAHAHSFLQTTRLT